MPEGLCHTPRRQDAALSEARRRPRYASITFGSFRIPSGAPPASKVEPVKAVVVDESQVAEEIEQIAALSPSPRENTSRSPSGMKRAARYRTLASAVT